MNLKGISSFFKADNVHILLTFFNDKAMTRYSSISHLKLYVL